MNEVVPNTNQWKEIAVELELTHTEIERIDKENPQEIYECFYQVFTKWEKSRRVPYCWRSIVKALEAPAVDEKSIARTISVSDKYLKKHE